MGTLVALSPAVGLLLHRFEGLVIGGLLLDLHHVRGAGLGGRGEAAQCGQRGCTIRIQAFGLQLGLGQKNLPPLHLLLHLIIVRLWGE